MLLKKYILQAVGEMFFPFFFVLFFISSIVLLLNISVLTNGIKISAFDLLLLYLYGIPGNVFFVIAITFYAACILGLSRLSYDSEMLVFFSLGVSPASIIRILLPLSIMVTFVLLMFSFVMMPLSKNAYRDFIGYKKNIIDINLKPGDFGQKIGDWLVYIDEKEEGIYKGLVLYSNNVAGSKKSFVVAREGEILNKNGVLELLLRDGNSYIGNSEGMQKIHFDSMIVRNTLADPKFSSDNIYEYWLPALRGDYGRLRALVQAISISFFPVASIFFILFFGIRNPRFQKNFAYSYVIVSGGLYLIIMYILSVKLQLACLFLPIIWLIVGRYYYVSRIKRFY
ncbi:LptF/LptG family permease [Helicobacter muridarum]|uniref:Integral membrane protein n=1 Tax=Helicobacter muridarum TaxID=216 RepID=A0A377PV35_9HELI|nr:LptF/LptG family permease [Helicobacter muridarum]TLE00798.1 LptF/LptG family permease [Helicobacter muridarum]STQ86515.1 integral membrane protein [Helicobacter muridarum]